MAAHPGPRPINRGDVVLVHFPFTDLSATKRRPAVVLWADTAQTDFLLAFISSRDTGSIGPGELFVAPAHSEFTQTGLSVPSKIRATKLASLSRSPLARWLGRLGPLLTAELDRTLVAALTIDTDPYREEGRRVERARLASLHAAGGANSVLSDLGRSAG